MSANIPAEEPHIEVITDDHVEYIPMSEAQARILAKVFATGKLEEESHEALEMILQRQREIYLLQDQQAKRATAMTAVGLVLLGVGMIIAARASLRAEERSEYMLRLIREIREETEAARAQSALNEKMIRITDGRVRGMAEILGGVQATPAPTPYPG